MFPYDCSFSHKLSLGISSDLYPLDQVILLCKDVLSEENCTSVEYTPGSGPSVEIYAKIRTVDLRNSLVDSNTRWGINMVKIGKKSEATEIMNSATSPLPPSPGPINQLRTPVVAKRMGLAGGKSSPLATEIRASQSRKRSRSPANSPSTSSLEISPSKPQKRPRKGSDASAPSQPSISGASPGPSSYGSKHMVYSNAAPAPPATPTKPTKRIQTGPNVSAPSQSSFSDASPGPTDHIVDSNAVPAPPATPAKTQRRRIKKVVIKPYQGLRQQVLGLNSTIRMVEGELELIQNVIKELGRSKNNVKETLSEFIEKLRDGLPFLDASLNHLRIAHKALTGAPVEPVPASDFDETKAEIPMVDGDDEELEKMLPILDSRLSQSEAKLALAKAEHKDEIHQFVLIHDFSTRFENSIREAISSMGIVSQSLRKMGDIVDALNALDAVGALNALDALGEVDALDEAV